MIDLFLTGSPAQAPANQDNNYYTETMVAVSVSFFVNRLLGLSGELENIQERQKAFGSNYIEPKPPKAFHRFIWEAFQDLTLIILTIAAIVSLGLSFYHAPTSSENGEGQNQIQYD